MATVAEPAAIAEARPDTGIQWAPVALVALSLFLFIARLPLTGEYLGFSSDMGSYLQTRNWVLGIDPTGHMPLHWRPPLVGVLLVPFTALWGDILGSKILAVTASVLPAFGMYALARRFVTQGWAAIAAIALILHPALADITAGGYLTLLALPLALYALALLTDTLIDHTRMVALPVTILALFGLNQTVAGLFVPIALVFIAAMPGHRKNALLALTMGLLASAVWAPFYIGSINTTGGFFLPGVPMVFLTPSFDALTMTSFAIFMGSLFVRPWGRPFAVLGILLLGISWLSSGDAMLNNTFHRAAYLIPAFAVLCTIVLAQGLPSIKWDGVWKSAAVAGAGLLFLGLSAAWWLTFDHTASDLNMLTANDATAITWIKNNTPKDSTVFAHPNGLGWWVGGLAPRNWYGSWYAPLKAYEGVQAAWECTLGWKTGCDPYALRDIYGVDTLLIDRGGWQPVAGMPDDGWDQADAAPWLVKEAEYGETVIYGWKASQ